MNKFILKSLLCLLPLTSLAQYSQLVEAKVSTIDGVDFGIIRLSRKDNHVKVKYFAAKDYDGQSVYQRYQDWAIGKKIIAYSSGTYMNGCNASSIATPVGMCIDQGNIVNRELVYDNLDALAVVYATGGMVASNLDDGNLRITDKNGITSTLDIRKSSYQKAQFINWATENSATVFQTHLYVFEDNFKISSNGSTKVAQRRFLGVCKGSDGIIYHYIINLPTPSTEYDGARKAYRILKELEDVQQIVFMINLDTGCQDVFSVFSGNGNQYSDKLLNGSEVISNAVNLLAYYYE